MPSSAPARSFRDLEVWKLAHDFALGIYRLSATFPKAECFGLTSQLRRAAVSVSANIAEGFRRRGNRDKSQFMRVALGSADECLCLLLLAGDLGYGDVARLIGTQDTIARMLRSYLAKLES